MEELRSQLGPEESVVAYDGFDAAIIGSAALNGMQVLVYSRPRCVCILMLRNKMSPQAAEEWIDFNFGGMANAPILME